MSHQTVQQATEDQALKNRVIAATQKEVQNNATLSGTKMAQMLRDVPNYAVQWFMYPVAIDYESEYEYAVNSDNPDPGGDSGVITDANITAAISAHWPPDPEPSS